jgi:hypothetical protein
MVKDLMLLLSSDILTQFQVHVVNGTLEEVAILHLATGLTVILEHFFETDPLQYRHFSLELVTSGFLPQMMFTIRQRAQGFDVHVQLIQFACLGLRGAGVIPDGKEVEYGHYLLALPRESAQPELLLSVIQEVVMNEQGFRRKASAIDCSYVLLSIFDELIAVCASQARACGSEFSGGNFAHLLPRGRLARSLHCFLGQEDYIEGHTHLSLHTHFHIASILASCLDATAEQACCTSGEPSELEGIVGRNLMQSLPSDDREVTREIIADLPLLSLLWRQKALTPKLSKLFWLWFSDMLRFGDSDLETQSGAAQSFELFEQTVSSQHGRCLLSEVLEGNWLRIKVNDSDEAHVLLKFIYVSLTAMANCGRVVADQLLVHSMLSKFLMMLQLGGISSRWECSIAKVLEAFVQVIRVCGPCKYKCVRRAIVAGSSWLVAVAGILQHREVVRVPWL